MIAAGIFSLSGIAVARIGSSAVITFALAAEPVDVDVDVTVTVEGHVCRDLAYNILTTARGDGADHILVGHLEENPDVTETIEYDAPCDVLFANDLTEAAAETDVVTVGTGGGPRHDALLDLVDRLRRTGTEVHLVTVTPSAGGTEERVERTLERAGEWSDAENVVVHEAAANTVAEGLVDAASEHGGPLFIGASRTRMVRRRVFGSTPDRVIGRAEERDVPVVVYAHATGISSRLTDRLFPLYRYLRRKTSRSRRAQSSGVPTSTDPDDRAD